MLKVAVIDDDPLYAIELELMLTTLNYRVLLIPATDVDAIKKSIFDNSPDIVLTDIFFAKRPVGLLLAKEFAKLDIAYILYTANDRPGVFDVAERMAPYAYLVRPFDSITLDRTIKLALVHHVKNQKDKVDRWPFSAKNVNGDLVKSDFNDVLAIEAVGNYCYFHLSEEKLVIRSSLVKLIDRLPKGMFFRVHRRYLVPTRLISRVNMFKSEIYIGEKAYPIGAKYSKELVSFMNK